MVKKEDIPMEADIVIIGGGGAGLPAALTAHEKETILERSNEVPIFRVALIVERYALVVALVGLFAIAGILEAVTLEVLDSFGNRVRDYEDTVFVATSTSGMEQWALGAGAQGAVDSTSWGQWFYVFYEADSGIVDLQVKLTVMETVTLTASRHSISGVSADLAVDML